MKTSMIAKVVTCCIGIIIGIAIIAIGFNVQSPETYKIGEYNLLGDSISFGADFYTEMYAVTQDTGNAVNNATREICSAIGWLIVAIGAFDICFFLSKMFDTDISYIYGTKAENDKDRHIKMGEQSAPTSIPSVLTKETEEKPVTASSALTDVPPSSANASVDKWVCSKCQAENSINYGQCKKCGSFRSDNKVARELTEKEKMDGYWICKKCHTKNMSSRDTCWCCDSLR